MPKDLTASYGPGALQAEAEEVLMFRQATCATNLLMLIVLASPVSAHEPARATARAATLPASARAAANIVDAFHAALRLGDLESAASMLASDAQIFEEGKVERSKSEYAAHHLPADAALSKVVPSTVTRRTGGANGHLAWITSEGRMTGTYNGKPIDRVTTETMVLRRDSAAWRIVHIHWSSASAQ